MLFVIETSFSGGGPPRTAFLLDARGVDPPAVAAAAEEASAAKASNSFWPCCVLLGAGRGGGVGERRPEPPSPPPPLGAEVKVDKAATAVSSFKFKLSLTRSDKLLAAKGNQIFS